MPKKTLFHDQISKIEVSPSQRSCKPRCTIFCSPFSSTFEREVCRQHQNNPSASTHERNSRACSRTHARTHARLVRTTLVRSLDSIGATPRTYRTCEKTNDRRGARGEERTRQISVCCPSRTPLSKDSSRAVLENRVHGNKGKCGRRSVNRSAETVNPSCATWPLYQ